MYKSILFASMTVVSVMLFGACHIGNDHDDDHDHDHEGEEAVDTAGHKHSPDIIEFSDEQAKAAGLKVEQIKPSDFAEVIEVSGRVLPASGAEATVTATMAGIVSFAGSPLTEGGNVAAGQSLFVVNAQPMADGNPAAAAQSELRAARQAYERAQKLATDRIIAQRELEDARQRFETAQAAAKSLGSAAQIRAVKAPIGGYIKNLLVRPGDYVSAGQALATVTQSRRVQLRADVPERSYSALSRIRTANFRMAYDESGRVYSLDELGGRLVAKGMAAEADDYFVPVIFEFNNKGNVLSGSYAEVYLQGATRSGVISIPNEAITEAQGLHFVYVQVEDHEYRRQEVMLGAKDGRRTEILSGLSTGDKVVTCGATQVRLAANATAVPEGHSHSH